MASCRKDHLVCPICIDIIDHATLLSCGHTFCRGCLEELHEQRRAREHLTCPVCRSNTSLTQKGIEGLSPNVIINGLVDDYKTTRDSVKVCHLHKEHEKELFCQQCSVHICVRCVVTGHLNHPMKTKEDFEMEIQEKVDCLMQCGQAKKEDLETVIASTEAPRAEVTTAVSNLERCIKNAFARKSRFLKEHEASLLDEVRSMQRNYNVIIDDQTMPFKQMIGDINRALTEITADELGTLEADRLAGHTVACNDLDELLGEAPRRIDAEVTTCAKEAVLNAEFHPVGDDQLNLGMIKTKKKLKVLREVKLPYAVEGLTANSLDTVEVGYGAWRAGSDLYGVHECDDVLEFKENDIGEVWDIAKIIHGQSAVSNGTHSVTVYNSDYRPTYSKYKCTRVAYACQICSDQNGLVYVVNGTQDIAIFQVRRTVNSQRIIRTGDFHPRQVAVTSTGVIVASTCDITPSTVTVFSEDGAAGSSIKAGDDNECLFATVDSRDQVWIGRIRQDSNTLKIATYTLQGNVLAEKITWEGIQLPLEVNTSLGSLCHLVSLTPELLVFAHFDRLTFFKVLDFQVHDVFWTDMFLSDEDIVQTD